MSIRNKRELAVTQAKLRMLEERYATLKGQPNGNDHVRELSLQSLKRLINQLIEEISRFEARLKTPGEKAAP